MRVQSELQAGESLRWSGVTDARRAAFAAIPEAILFGGPFVGPAVLYMYYGYRAAGEMPRSSSNALSPGFGVLLFGVPFLVIGLISLLRPLWVYRTELDTVYAVTNQRVMIISGDGSRPVRSLRDIYAVQHHERRDGSGDVVIRTYGTGSVNVGQSFFILDVWQPSSKKVIWSASKNVGTSWSTHTGIANLVKKLREDMEEQEKSAPKLDGVSKAGSANPQN
jgi:hypothetical protein